MILQGATYFVAPFLWMPVYHQKSIVVQCLHSTKAPHFICIKAGLWIENQKTNFIRYINEKAPIIRGLESFFPGPLKVVPRIWIKLPFRANWFFVPGCWTAVD